MNDFLELLVGATASGCVYALVALSYLLITRPTGVINFAVGEWSMLAAFGGFVLLSRLSLPYPVGMVLVLGGMFLIGWATERLTVRPLLEKGAPALAPILALLGMLVVFREVVSLRFWPTGVGADCGFLPELFHHRRHAVSVCTDLVFF
jgi:branched-chain amino acid transport system permease protein